VDLRQSQIVELRFFGGLSIEDTSQVLDISPATVKREWVTARAWLYVQMNRES
jgi:DNA-directed RNA polymerase specialized sigma24 family protein